MCQNIGLSFNAVIRCVMLADFDAIFVSFPYFRGTFGVCSFIPCSFSVKTPAFFVSSSFLVDHFVSAVDLFDLKLRTKNTYQDGFF